MAAPENGEDLVHDESDRGLGWRILYPFLKHRCFRRWNGEEVAKPYIEETCPLAIKLFISHRWASPDDPDPDHKDLPAVVEYLTRVYMVANGFMNSDSLPIKELVISDELLAAFHQSQLALCRCGSVGWLDLRLLLQADDLFFNKVTEIDRRRNFYKLLKHVRVWYDYSSLPQARGAGKEKALLDRALTHLADIVGQSEVLALWGLESIKRAWCIFEVLAARKVHFCSRPSLEMSPAEKFIWRAVDEPCGKDSYGYRGRPGQNILIEVDRFRSDVTGLSEREICEYLRTNAIQCTEAADLARLARLIHRYLGEQRA